MSSDPSKAVDIVEERGSFLLVCAGLRFAVVERRNGRIYPTTPGKHESVPVTSGGMAMLLKEKGSLPEREARRRLNELSERGERLAQSLR